MRRVNAFATASDHESLAVIDRELILAKAAHAAENPRRREIHRFHADDADNLHRMLNALEPDSYVRPHRHLDPPKSEVFLIMRGRLGVVLFGDDGSVTEDGLILLDAGRGVYGVDIRPGAWHAVVSLEPGTVVYEVKPGPYSPVTDKDFAPFAPPDGAPEAAAYLAALEDRLRRAHGLGERDGKKEAKGRGPARRSPLTRPPRFRP